MATERAGDVGAVGREALAYADTLHNLAHYLAGNEPDAQDLVQETYARALRSLHQFTPGTNLKAWLCRILRNTFVSEYRRRRGSPVVGGLDTVDPVPDVADREIDALRKVMADEIEAALMRLGEDARTVILLDLEGLTEVEVAMGGERAGPERVRQGKRLPVVAVGLLEVDGITMRDDLAEQSQTPGFVIAFPMPSSQREGLLSMGQSLVESLLE